MAKSVHKGAHLYERFTTKKGKNIYKCMIPGCPHSISNPELIINRMTRCWGECGRELVMTKEYYQENIKKPLCEECRNERKAQRAMLASIPIRLEGED